MSIAIAAAAVFLFAGSGGTQSVDPRGVETSSPRADVSSDPQALDRAEEFLAKVDAGEWEASWNAAGELFQSEVTAAQWAAQVEPLRQPLGKVLGRRLTNEQFVTNMPGGPEGEFRIMQFQTHFEGKSGNSIETVVMMQGKDGWEITGYFIA